jgi:hypothetical protein
MQAKILGSVSRRVRLHREVSKMLTLQIYKNAMHPATRTKFDEDKVTNTCF